MYRIFRLINRFNLGGPTYNVTYLSRYLPADFETLLAGGVKEEAEGDSEFIPRQYGLSPVIIPTMKRRINPYDDFLAYLSIKRLIREFKPHIVHTHASKAGVLGRIAAINCNVPITVHTYHGHIYHSYFSPVKNKVFKTIDRALAKRTTALIALSEKQKQELSEEHHIAPENKFHIVPLGFDLERFMTGIPEKRYRFREKYFLDSDVIAIGIIGRITAVKNHPFFLKSFSEAKKKTNQKIKAFVIGDGELKADMINLCRDLGLKASHDNQNIPDADVVFTSWVTDSDEAVAGLDIIALTSLNEGTPVSLIEAQAGGKPIIATIAGGIENIVLPGKTALLSPQNNLELFTENLSILLNNNELRKEMSIPGPLFARQHFHYTVLIRNMSALYAALLKDKNILPD
jgi:glycosyltransferase involved in cell wall biosynthesis